MSESESLDGQPEQSFTAAAWAATADIRLAIDRHAFLTGLRDGTLPEETFIGYLAQDARYLVGYARALALCAGQATDTDDISFWASNAHDAIAVERSLHEIRVADFDAVEASPTCAAYVGFLLGLAGQGSYPVLAAGLLPCFWIYQDVGQRLADEVDVAGHPYADWISTYGDPGFAAVTQQAKNIVDRLADAASTELRGRMQTAFAAAARYEWMFWDSAWRGESWPVFGAANGRAIRTATAKEATDADSHG